MSSSRDEDPAPSVDGAAKTNTPRTVEERKRTPPGTEKEIDAMSFKLSRDKVVVKASRKWKEFGGECSFGDRDSVETFSSSTMECRPFKDQSYDKALAEQEVSIQSVPDVNNVAAQTNQYTYALQQNEVMDLFEDDFENLAEEEDHSGHKSITNIMEYQSFSDLLYSKGKMVSAIDWMPGKHGVLAAACSESKSFDERLQISGKPSNSYVLIWSFSDPIYPQIILESPSDVFSLSFNPTTPTIVAGGCYNGQVILWDISAAEEQMGKYEKDNVKDFQKDKDEERRKKAPKVNFSLLSSISKSHTAIVSDLHWVPGIQVLEDAQKIVRQYSQETYILVSIAADGKIIFWDTSPKKHLDIDLEPLDDAKSAELASEKYRWNPVLQIDLMASKTPQRQLGVLKIVLLSDSSFACGNESGDLLEGDINTLDRSNVVKSISECHNGQVRSLQRSPFFEDIILSVDVWTFALWRIGFKKPIFVSRSVEGYLTTGCWSPSRPGVIYIGSIDGSIEVWDLIDHSHQPSLTASIGSCQVTSMEFCLASPRLLAVGDIQGVLHIMEIPRRLQRTNYKEKALMQKFFERQEAWVNNVEGRATERAKQASIRQKEESYNEEREKQLARCCWDDEMEAKYQQYESECRQKFRVSVSYTQCETAQS
ncbi:hypothetical protein KP509_25G072000 [Ceratopteris richardii]|uniref:Uncharacterized protein n=2 Tax=Ceratopteris richardii TaxID=49495 RepID=A0A8T2RRJ4_CERRI|nr:hypothetical protein KP509_25G072000 [Ceratopteris richardii]KAH7299087.1 hypothetical protein KP509_25G072000 [Ceratopteris richardii]